MIASISNKDYAWRGSGRLTIILQITIIMEYAIIKTIIAEPVAGKGVGAASKINGVNNAQRARSRYCY